MMIEYFIVPGLGNSGPAHWQTYFENTLFPCTRIEQREWDAPACNDWITAIDNALAGADLSKVVLIGHSLGCAAIVHWARQYNKKIKGAMLVAPSDLESPKYAFPATGFKPVPLFSLPFKTILVASTNDPWVSAERALFFAEQWGSEFINIGDAEHINAAAGFGEWPEGIKLLQKLES